MWNIAKTWDEFRLPVDGYIMWPIISSLHSLYWETNEQNWQKIMRIIRQQDAFLARFWRVYFQILQMCHFKTWRLFFKLNLRSEFWQKPLNVPFDRFREGGTQYKRPYGNVPPTWVVKSGFYLHVSNHEIYGNHEIHLSNYKIYNI